MIKRNASNITSRFCYAADRRYRSTASSNLLNFIPVADGRRFDKKPEMKGDGARACVGCPFPPLGKSLNRMNIEFHLRPSNAMRAESGWIVILAADKKKKKKYLARKDRGEPGSKVFSFETCDARDQSIDLLERKPSTRETLDTAQDNKGAFKNRRADRSRWPSVARTLVLGRIRRIPTSRTAPQPNVKILVPTNTEILINFPARFSFPPPNFFTPFHLHPRCPPPSSVSPLLYPPFPAPSTYFNRKYRHVITRIEGGILIRTKASGNREGGRGR